MCTINDIVIWIFAFFSYFFSIKILKLFGISEIRDVNGVDVEYKFKESKNEGEIG